MALGLSGIELIFIMLWTSGGQATDLVTFLEPEVYFQTRNINPAPAKMVELAGKDPVDGKTQIAQLLALRWLGEQADKVKKDPQFGQYRLEIEKITGGTKAQDAQGFAKDYAARLLHRLDGTQPQAAGKQPLADGLRWFPASAVFVACADLRNLATGPEQISPLLHLIYSKLPKRERDQMFQFADEVGNLRVDRVSLAVEQEKDTVSQVYIRYTGKMNPTWLTAKIKAEMASRFDVEELKGQENLTLFHKVNDPVVPAAALIGNSDLLVVIGQSNNVARLKQVLKNRSNQPENAATGTLNSKINEISPKAFAMLSGQFPEDLRRELRGGPFSTFPRTVTGQVLHNPLGFDFDFKGDLESPEETKAFVQGVSKLRNDGLNTLKQLKGNPGLPPQMPLDSFEKLVESIQIEGQGKQALFKMHISTEVLQALPQWFITAMGAAEVPPPPPPAPKQNQ